MTQLSKLLETLIKSNLSLALIGKNHPTALKVGHSDHGYVIGPNDDKILSFRCRHENPTNEFIVSEQYQYGDKVGVTRLVLNNNMIYILHQTKETLPEDVEYDIVPKEDIIIAYKEIDGR